MQKILCGCMYLHAMLHFSDVKLEDVSLEVMTNKWQNGDISNYDYLLYLNKYVCVGYYAHVLTFCWQIHVRNNL